MFERRIGVILLVVGGVLLLSAILGTGFGWLWIAAVSAAFFIGYRMQREPGLLVPAGVLAGISLGIFLESFLNNVFLFGLSAGFASIALLEPKLHAWALWPAGILAVIGTFIVIGTSPVLFALVLVTLGLLFLLRR